MGILKNNKNKAALTVFVFLVFSLVASLIPTTTFASTYSETTDLKKKVAMYDYAQMVYGCYLANDGVETNSTKVQSGQLFYFGPGVRDVGAVSYTPEITASVQDLGADHYTYCGSNDGNLSKAALSSWGINGLDLVCAMGYKRDGNGTDCKQSTDRNFQAWGGINSSTGRANAFKSTVRSLVGVDIDNPGQDVAYLYWRNYVVTGCTTKNGVPANQTSVSGDMRYELKELSGGGETTLVYSGGKSKGDYPLAGSRNVPNNVTCGVALERANAAFPAYLTSYTAANARQQCQAKGYTNVPGGSFPGKNDLTACIQGMVNKDNVRFCVTAYPDYSYQGTAMSRETERAACAWGQGRSINYEGATNDLSSPQDADPTTTNCTIEGLGWIICPAVTIAATATDALWGWIDSALVVPNLNTDTGASNNTMYIAWMAMRNVANVAFVIAFIIIIYAQLTGVGVSNYGVKKLLPRLIIAAILVNISYWIAAIAVDISNIIGNNIYNILRNGINLGDVTIEANPWQALTAAVLSGGAIAGGVVGGVALATVGTSLVPVLLWGLVVLLLGVVLALVVAFLILAIRQALIVILIVLSPLAFVAMLLPNTEKFFTIWRKSLTTLLIFYPLFALLFGGSYLAGLIIIGSATPDGGDSASLLTVLIGLAVMVLPLWLTPMIVRFSSGVMGQVAGIVNNKSKGLIDRARNVRNRKAGLAFGEAMQNPRNRKNPFSRIYRAVNNSSKGDAERRKIIDNNNQTSYLGTTKGTKLSYDSKLAGEKAELAGLKHSAEYEELKSEKLGPVSPDHPYHDLIQGARSTELQTNVTHGRLDSAKRVLQQEYADDLTNPTTGASLRTAAGGIDPYGASRVEATAISAIADAEAKAIAAEKTTMSKFNSAQLQAVYRDTTASAERRAAAIGLVLKNGADPDIYQALDDAASYAGTPEGITIQQQVAADLGPRKPMGLGAADMSALAQGSYSGAFDSKLIARFRNGKISAEALHNATADELKRFQSLLAAGAVPAGDPALLKLKADIGTYKTSPTYRAPSKEISDLVDDVEIRIR